MKVAPRVVLQGLVAERDRQLLSKDRAAGSLSEKLRETEALLDKQQRQSASNLEDFHNVRPGPLL